ncbi:hypothetical protein GCM10009001_09100 [Virgibacillus siamensis]|uniref:Uncharacterized protein n=1 Tax=Virgibacillus siamensis TaxID=480071 RepID=A0ABN1FPT0_9BACI
MLQIGLYVVFLAALFGFISWRKYNKYKNPQKQTNHQTKSTEELEQEQNKYRGVGQISGPM